MECFWFLCFFNLVIQLEKYCFLRNEIPLICTKFPIQYIKLDLIQSWKKRGKWRMYNVLAIDKLIFFDFFFVRRSNAFQIFLYKFCQIWVWLKNLKNKDHLKFCYFF